MENKAISSDLIRGHVDTIILHTLLDGDKFPQQISELITKKSDGKYEINQATLYSSLKRLETLKFVQAYWHDTIGGRRKYFRLTESGKETVNANLSNWSYSRSIIDKLMDVEPEHIVKTQYVEKVVVKEVPVANQQPVVPQPAQPKQEVASATQGPSSVQISSPIVYQREESEKEKNFRNILNGLIVATRKDSPAVKKALDEPINTAENQEKPSENNVEMDKKQRFSETIDETHKFALKDNIGKIDFGDLSVKVAKDGYKLRVSSKGPRIAKGSLYANKINFISSLAVCILALLEFLIVSLTCKSFLNITTPVIILCLLAIIAFPVIMFAIYKKTPLKTTNKIHGDTVLTAIIIAFNLILITFAISLLFSVDLSNTKSLCLAFIFPLLVYVDAFMFFLARFVIAKLALFNVKKKD